MKTLIIYNLFPEDLPKFAIVDGDYTKFDGIKINGGADLDLTTECVNFLYSEKTNECNIDFSSDVSLVSNKQWDKVAMITFFI